MRNLRQVFVIVSASTLVLACGGDRNRQAREPSGQATTTASETQSQMQSQPGVTGATTGTSASPETSGISGAGGETAPNMGRRPSAMDEASETGIGSGDPGDTSGSMSGQGSVTQGSIGTGSDQSTSGQTGDTKAKTERALNDAEIFAVENTAHEGEIQMAELARKNASHAQVKQFAKMMVTDHGAAQQKAKSIAQKAKITASDSEVSNELKTDVQTMVGELRGLKGREFDRKYMAHQVTAHQRVLDLLDKRLMPSVSNAEMKTHLGEVRTKVSNHLSEAERIRTMLDQQPVGATGSDGAGSKAKGGVDKNKAKGGDTDRSKEEKGRQEGQDKKPQGGQGDRY